MAVDLQYAHVPRLVALGDQVANEIARIPRGLKSHNVMLHEQRNQLLVVRQRGQDLRRRERNMQEKPDPVGMAPPPQRVRDRDQMIIMDPDQIVMRDDFFEFGRKVIIDAEISAEVAPRKLGEVQPIMQNRPQHPIGEPVIVFLIIMFSQVGDDVFDVLVLDGSRSQLLSRSDFSAPSEPHASVVLQRRPQRHLKPAGALGAIAGGNRNPIGYDRQARQYRPQSSATDCLAVKTKAVEETVKERMSM